MERQIEQLQQEALQECRDAATKEALENVRIKYLGRKGQLTQLLRGMGQLSPEERPRIGGLVNRARDVLEGALAQRAEELGQAEEARRLKEEALDITLPGRRRVSGHKHPLTQVMEEIIRIFSGMGFQVAQGPEVETDYYNGNKKVSFELTGDINRKDFGLAYNSFNHNSGLSTGQDIKLVANLEFSI